LKFFLTKHGLRYLFDTFCDMATKAISSVAFNDLSMPFFSLFSGHPSIRPLVASSGSSGGAAAAQEPVFSATRRPPKNTSAQRM
jgi:hypothetical protein